MNLVRVSLLTLTLMLCACKAGKSHWKDDTLFCDQNGVRLESVSGEIYSPGYVLFIGGRRTRTYETEAEAREAAEKDARYSFVSCP